ncbi:MAG: phage tail sheath family protein [Roseburia sp.]|nr:phage tail sheath family protein [Roseburia sp.]
MSSKTYNHGVRTIENPTSMSAPARGTSGLQVIIGTAPVHTCEDYEELVNKPILIEDWDGAMETLGYSEDWVKYTLCQSMYACFKIYNISPVIFVNVLDPAEHAKNMKPVNWEAGSEKECTLENPDVVRNSIEVKDGESKLVLNEDYVVTVEGDGRLTLTLLAESGHYSAESLTITGKEISFDSGEMKHAVVGGYSAEEGINKGISCVNDVFPNHQVTPGLILAPGWSQYPEVSTALQAAAVNINGEFSANAVIDIDCSSKGARKCEDFQKAKEAQYVVDENAIAVWPKVRSDGKDFYYSAVYAAGISYIDASNKDVPNLSPSNKSALIDAVVLEDGKEVRIDKQRANNYVNAFGGVTAINYSGWKFWGNNTARYPDTKDPKDRWICARRFFNYYKNRLILTTAKRVDDLGDFRRIQAVCDDENVWFNAMQSQLFIAGGSVSYDPEDNPVENIIDGSIRYEVKLATYLPMEDILFEIEFDPEILEKALRGE